MTPLEVAALRHRLGLSQAALAERLGVGRAAVKDWESGRYAPRPASVDILGRLIAEHDEAVRVAMRHAVATGTVCLPRIDGSIAVAAVITALPGVRLEWAGDPA